MAEADAAESGDHGEFAFSAPRRIDEGSQGTRDVLRAPVSGGEKAPALLLEVLEAQQTGHACQPVRMLCLIGSMRLDRRQARLQLFPESLERGLAFGLANQRLEVGEFRRVENGFHI
jgi:hypothetical protein